VAIGALTFAGDQVKGMLSDIGSAL
jgi:hypothetical protein